MRSKLSENRPERANFIIPITVLWGFAALVVFAFVWLENDFGSLMEGFYLLPWALLTGIFVLAPSAYLIYKGKFDFFHPLLVLFLINKFTKSKLTAATKTVLTNEGKIVA